MSPIDLREFVAEVERFEGRRHHRSDFRPNLDMTYLPERGTVEDRSRQPDDDDFRAFLMDFRLFWAAGETYYLPNVHAALDSVTPSERLSAAVARLERLEGEGQVQQVFVTPGGQRRTLTNRELADWWMHGAYFHRSNAKKTAWWRGLNALERAAFQWTLREYVDQWTAEILEAAEMARIHLAAQRQRGPA